MKVLVACEFSGIVRDAFINRGHDAVSCDLRPTHSPGPHLQTDVLTILNQGWDLMIAHPPCECLTSAGRWYYKHRPEQTEAAFEFFMSLVNAPIEKICIENPRSGYINRHYRFPNQTIHPYYFGDGYLKKTCFWLKNLPRLNGLIEVARDPKKFIPAPKWIQQGGKTPGKKRHHIDCLTDGYDRSIFHPFVAAAMAEQWG